MKIIVLLFGSFLAFGFATQDAVSVKETQSMTVETSLDAAALEEAESPVMNVLLDTLEIAVSSQNVIAGI